MYCLSAWGNCSVTNLKRLLGIQKKAVRILNRQTPFSPVQSCFKSLHIFRPTELYVQSCARLAYKYLHGKIPTTELFTYTSNQQIHNHYTRNIENIHVPKVHSSNRQKTYAISSIRIWNSIPSQIRQKSSLHSFAKSIKQYLLQTSYEDLGATFTFLRF